MGEDPQPEFPGATDYLTERGGRSTEEEEDGHLFLTSPRLAGCLVNFIDFPTVVLGKYVREEAEGAAQNPVSRWLR